MGKEAPYSFLIQQGRKYTPEYVHTYYDIS